MQHDVGPEVERVLQVRRGESIVDADQDAAFAGDGAYGGNIHDAEHGVGWRFDPEQFGVGADLAGHTGSVRHVDKAAFQAPLSENSDHLAVRAAVQVIDGQHFVAARQQFHHGILCGEAGGKADGVEAVFEGGQVFFERGTRRVLGAGIFETFVVAGSGLHVGGGLENRRHDGARGGVRFDAGVNDLGGEFHTICG